MKYLLSSVTALRSLSLLICTENRIYENMHPTTRNDAQKTVIPRICIQTELKNSAYENVKAAKPVRKHPNKIRTKV